MASKSSGRRKDAAQHKPAESAVQNEPALVVAPATPPEPVAEPDLHRAPTVSAPFGAAADASTEERRTVAHKQASIGASVANDDLWRATPRGPAARKQRSSNLPFYVAAAVAPLWVAAAMTSAVLRGDFQRAGYFVSPDFVGLFALAILPAIGTFAIASLVKRSRDLRDAALAIAAASRHLAEPETSAKEVIVSIGGAVRRELEALDQGVGRALTRAGEIESILHNEVVALERTSAENEKRMRMLVTEMASQRDALTSNTDRTREVISESHSSLIFDLYGVSQRVSTSIMEAGNGLAQALDYRVSTLNDAFSGYSASFARMMTQGGMQMLDNLYAREKEITSALEQVGSRMAEDITDRASDAEGMMGRLSERLNEHVHTHVNELESRLHSSMIELTASMEATTERARLGLVEVGNGNLEQFEAQSQQVKSAIETGIDVFTVIVGNAGKRVTDALDRHQTDFETRANVLETALDTKAQDFAAAASRHTRELTETLADRSEQIAGVIGEKSREISEAFDTHGRDMVEALDGRTLQLSKALQARQAKLSETIGNRTQALADTLDARGAALDKSVAGHVDALTTLVSQSGQLIETTLDGYVRQVAGTLEERGAQIGATISARAGELDEVMTKRGRELDETLERRTDAFSAAITGRSFEMARAVETSTLGATRLFDDKIAEMDDSMARSADRVAQHITRSKTEIMGELDAFASGIDERSRHVVTAVEDSVAALHDSVRALLNDRLGALPQEISAQAEAATGRLSALNTSIEASLASALGSIEFSANRIHDQVGTGLLQSMQSIAGEIDTTVNHMDGTVRESLSRLQETSRELDGLISTRASEAAAAASERALEVNRLLTEATGDFDRVVGGRAAEIEQSLAGHAEVLEDTMTRLAADAETLMNRSTAHLTERAVATIARVAGSTQALKELVETSGSTLSETERLLAQSAESYATAVRQAAVATAQMGRTAEDRTASMAGSIAEMMREFHALEAGLDRVSTKLDSVPRPTLQPFVPSSLKADLRPSGRTNALPSSFALAAAPMDQQQASMLREDGQTSATLLSLVPKAPAPVDAATAEKAVPVKGNADDFRGVAARLNLIATPAPKAPEAADGADGDLNRLASRLAAAIDSEQLSSAWRRYQGGESGGFGKDLYAIGGRALFDLLHRRVKLDPKFADQARVVVDEFEPFLTACRSEPDPLEASLKVLLTEKGRVYVALAHALGRLA